MEGDIPYRNDVEALSAHPHLNGMETHTRRRMFDRAAAMGYAADKLTGCKPPRQLESDLIAALLKNVWKGQTFLTTTYLCMDIARFKHFNDSAGHRSGDQTLVEIADRLRANYAEHSIYRTGGDEFTVRLGGQAYKPVGPISGIRLRYSLVEIAARTDKARAPDLCRLILEAIDRGMCEAVVRGKKIVFRYPANNEEPEQ